MAKQSTLFSSCVPLPPKFCCAPPPFSCPFLSVPRLKHSGLNRERVVTPVQKAGLARGVQCRGGETNGLPLCCFFLSFLADRYSRERHSFWHVSSEPVGLLCPWILAIHTVNPGKKLCLIDQSEAMAGSAFLFRISLIFH